MVWSEQAPLIPVIALFPFTPFLSHLAKEK